MTVLAIIGCALSAIGIAWTAYEIRHAPVIDDEPDYSGYLDLDPDWIIPPVLNDDAVHTDGDAR